METHEVKTKGLTITAEDIREGIVGILSVFVREPMFQGQTKEKLNNPEMTATVDNFVRPALEAWLNTNMTAADQIVGRIVLAARARLASREAAAGGQAQVGHAAPAQPARQAGRLQVDRPGRDRSCSSSRATRAGGSAKQGRNNRTQAVLPLRGKILNSEGLALSKVLTNAELNDLVSAIGTGAGDKFDLDGLRYGKIILLMDADADGHHITTLMLAFFFRHMPELIRKGHVFIAQPPLYRIDVGKETFWARDDAHKEEILAGLRANAKPEITRFKGLGEMDAARPWRRRRSTRASARCLQVSIDSNLEADKTFVELLGKDPASRYQLHHGIGGAGGGGGAGCVRLPLFDSTFRARAAMNRTANDQPWLGPAALAATP